MSNGSVDNEDLVLAAADMSTSVAVLGVVASRRVVVLLLVDDDDDEMEKAEAVPVRTADVR
jgi:hypothetical protein